MIVTAAADSERCDFVSRFFAPSIGVAEDPVTGWLTAASAHSGQSGLVEPTSRLNSFRREAAGCACEPRVIVFCLAARLSP